MDLTRSVCSAALSLRKNRQLRVRLPLATLTVADVSAGTLAEFGDLIKDEVNVKELVLSADPASLGTKTLTVNPRALGPRLGKQVQEVIRAVKAGSWSVTGDVVVAGGVELLPGEYELRLTAADPDSTMSLPGSSGLIALDTRVTPPWPPRGPRATWSASSSRPGATLAWTCRTGSRWSSALTARSRTRCGRTRRSSPGKPSPSRRPWCQGRSCRPSLSRWATPASAGPGKSVSRSSRSEVGCRNESRLTVVVPLSPPVPPFK